MSNTAQLIQLLKKAKHAVVLTGAGISTLSGIPDFRGKNGFYNRKDIDAQRLFDIDEFMNDPSYYYTHSRDFIYNLEEKEPNIVHTELARLERTGVIKAIMTQNIDLLHQKAGSTHVLELHGSPSTHRCRTCGKVFRFEAIVHMLEGAPTPYCPCGGIIKPDIVFFGEPLPVDTLDTAQVEAHTADLMLVLGSSLTVYPAAALPDITHRTGGLIAVINADPTPMDRHAAWVGRDLREAFEAIAAGV